MKDDEDGSRGGDGPLPLNGDDSDLMEEDEASFEEECLPMKHSMDEDDLEDLDDDLQPRLIGSEGGGSCGGAPVAGRSNSLDTYPMSVNSVISIRMKRKEEHLDQQKMHSKRIKMEQLIRNHYKKHYNESIADDDITSADKLEDEEECLDTDESASASGADKSVSPDIISTARLDDVSSDDEALNSATSEDDESRNINISEKPSPTSTHDDTSSTAVSSADEEDTSTSRSVPSPPSEHDTPTSDDLCNSPPLSASKQTPPVVVSSKDKDSTAAVSVCNDLS